MKNNIYAFSVDNYGKKYLYSFSVNNNETPRAVKRVLFPKNIIYYIYMYYEFQELRFS